jgi:hypothetical protein
MFTALISKYKQDYGLLSDCAVLPTQGKQHLTKRQLFRLYGFTASQRLKVISFQSPSLSPALISGHEYQQLKHLSELQVWVCPNFEADKPSRLSKFNAPKRDAVLQITELTLCFLVNYNSQQIDVVEHSGC